MITNKKLICLKKLKDSAEPSASLKDVSEYIFESVCITLYIREFQNKLKIVNWNYNYNGGFFFRNINESINIYISFNWYVHLFILIISEHLFIYQYIFFLPPFWRRAFFDTRQLFTCGWWVLDWFVCPCFRPVVFLLVKECHALESSVFVFTVWVSKTPAVPEEDQRVTVEHSCMTALSLSFIFNLKEIELSSVCSQ